MTVEQFDISIKGILGNAISHGDGSYEYLDDNILDNLFMLAAPYVIDRMEDIYTDPHGTISIEFQNVEFQDGHLRLRLEVGSCTFSSYVSFDKIDVPIKIYERADVKDYHAGFIEFVKSFYGKQTGR